MLPFTSNCTLTWQRKKECNKERNERIPFTEIYKHVQRNFLITINYLQLFWLTCSTFAQWHHPRLLCVAILFHYYETKLFGIILTNLFNFSSVTSSKTINESQSFFIIMKRNYLELFWHTCSTFAQWHHPKLLMCRNPFSSLRNEMSYY